MVAFRDRDKPAPEKPATLDGLRKQVALLQVSGADSEVMKSIQARREDIAPMLKHASDPAIQEKLTGCLDALAAEEEVDNPEALALLEAYRADPTEWQHSQGIELDQEVRTLINRLEELAKKG